MFPELAHHDKLYDVLHAIDVDLAKLTRRARCPSCGGPLHWATYERKPRGGPEKLPDEYLVRLGLCCGRPDCRRRVLPASTLFMGRRVYWGGVVLVVLALRQQRPDGYSARRLRELCGVSRKTLPLDPVPRIWLRSRVNPSPGTLAERSGRGTGRRHLAYPAARASWGRCGFPGERRAACA